VKSPGPARAAYSDRSAWRMSVVSPLNLLQQLHMTSQNTWLARTVSILWNSPISRWRWRTRFKWCGRVGLYRYLESRSIRRRWMVRRLRWWSQGSISLRNVWWASAILLRSLRIFSGRQVGGIVGYEVAVNCVSHFHWKRKLSLGWARVCTVDTLVSFAAMSGAVHGRAEGWDIGTLSDTRPGIWNEAELATKIALYLERRTSRLRRRLRYAVGRGPRGER
jgi:hypothetical protein